MDRKKRDAKIQLLRRKGEDPKVLKKRFNLSLTRIYQICAKEIQRNSASPEKSFENSISSKTQEALICYFGSDTILDQPEIVAEEGAYNLLTFAGDIGSTRVKEIANALHEIGQVENPDEWAKEEPLHVFSPGATK